MDFAIFSRTIIQNSHGNVVVLANHSKFGWVAKVAAIPLKNLSILVINRKLFRDFQKDLENVGLHAMIA